jgi:hypothetical protein
MLRRLLVVSLGCLLASCGAHQQLVTEPSEPRELSRNALVIEETADGQVTHAWVPASSFDLERYARSTRQGGSEGSLVRASFNRDCEEERDRCEEMCQASLRGRTWSHATPASKVQICTARCRPAYLDCCRLKEQAEAVKFSVPGEAVDWLKRHRKELLVGTLVVISGVAFVVVVGGSGGAALVLVPSLLFVSAEAPSGSSMAVGPP